jgi:hypothetical protein
MKQISSATLARSAVLLLIVGGTTGCVRRVGEGEIPAPGYSPAPSRCLALSGGGLRSGAVSLGALQGLHANGGLHRFTYLSSVSGGGYPVYGLAYRMINNQAKLSDLLSEDSDHIRRADEGASFVGGIAYAFPAVPIWVVLSSITPYSAAQPSYTAKIHRTFAGGWYSPFGNPKLSMGRHLPALGFPQVIFGASAKRGAGPSKGHYEYRASEYFEMSSDSSGSPEYGYYASFGKAVRFGEAAAVSSAAIDHPEEGAPKLARAFNVGLGTNVSLPRASGQRLTVFLSDAGFVENLGILPLLRRGCTDILAFDNSHDDSVTFRSWHNFIAKAKEEGWKVGSDLVPESGKDQAERRSAWTLTEHNWDAMLVGHGTTATIRLVKLGLAGANLDRYPPSVRAYFRDSNNGALQCTGRDNGLRCPFPMESTRNQSYSVPEFRAYRKLGRCLAILATVKGGVCDGELRTPANDNPRQR